MRRKCTWCVLDGINYGRHLAKNHPNLLPRDIRWPASVDACVTGVAGAAGVGGPVIFELSATDGLI